ncbi:hypothetical protein [Phytohabitans rumicis]|uniref:hypothetical protein n=1 Tax=Phytohabitans rumicis TaxID=1076125 RepID=UPI0031EC70B7
MDDLAARFARVVDLDELVAALEAAGINDRAAALRYGVPDVFALGEAVLARLHQPPAHPPRPARRLRPWPLLLVPVLGALIVAGHLDRVGWALPAGALLLAWVAGRGRHWLGTALAALPQAAAAVLVWRAAPAAAVLVLGVPLIVLFVRWYAARAATAADTHDDARAFRREVRDLATVTLGALAPPLVAGVALGGAAYRLPYRLSGHPEARALVLGLAAGLLLCGVLALTALLIARGRPVVAAAVALGAALSAVSPVLVVGLAVTYLVGLIPAVHAVVDPDRY